MLDLILDTSLKIDYTHSVLILIKFDIFGIFYYSSVQSIMLDSVNLMLVRKFQLKRYGKSLRGMLLAPPASVRRLYQA